jgi:hypothetical protein
MTTKFNLHSAISIAALLIQSSTAAASISFVSSSPITGSIKTEAGYNSPQGNYAAFTNPQNIALGHTAMVSGTIPGYPIIHNAANLTDGNYGNGRSWIDSGPNPWLTIDLGSTETFNTLSFGRDRLGGYTERNPGQFTISTSNDNSLFTPIFDSRLYGFSGSLGFAQTVQSSFSTVSAQYVRLQLSNSGAAIDEVEIKFSAAPVPEPEEYMRMMLGFGMVGWQVTRKQRKSASTR